MSSTRCTKCGHHHSGVQLAYICIGCPCPETPGKPAEPEPTYQQKLEADRESLRQQLAEATIRNRIRVSHFGGVSGAMARDNAGRIVLVTLDDDSLDELIADALEVQRVRRELAKSEDKPAPATERNPRIDEIRGAT
jgi:hypothetical protein